MKFHRHSPAAQLTARHPGCGMRPGRGGREAGVICLLIVLAAACSDDTTGPDTGTPSAVTVSPAAAPPGSLVVIHGLPAAARPETHWVTVGGERTPLITTDDAAMFVVPSFMDGDDTWPAPPAGTVEIEIHSPSGVAAASEGFTVQPLVRADGTTAGLAADLESIVASLTALADAVPPAAGETARFMFAISRSLDSLQHNADYSVASALAALDGSPDETRLLDALIAANGVDESIARVARTLEGVATALPPDTFPSLAPIGTSSGRGDVREAAAAAAAIEALTDVRLSQLMQLAVYLKQNTDFQSQLGSDLSGVLGLATVLNLNADKHAPIAKVLDAIAVASSLQALLTRTYLLSALPSRLDSITLVLASDTLRPGQRTDATIEVHASSEPDPLSVGDLISAFQSVAGLFAKGDYVKKATNWVVSQAGTLMKWFADENPHVEYDPDIYELPSIPKMYFKAKVDDRSLINLQSLPQDVVRALDDDVNWEAVAQDTATAAIQVSPSVGQADIPVLMEWLADYVSENSGDASDIVMGSFGEDMTASASVDVVVAPASQQILFTFDDDLEGWQTGTVEDHSLGWGSAQWRDWCGDDRDEGCIKLDGVGGAGEPNAWVYRAIQLPSAATTLEFETTAHDRDGSDSEYRVRLVDAAGFSTTLVDWTASSGSEGDYTWQMVTVSIAAWAGEEVTIYLEGGDNGPGSHEQRYYDNVRIY